MLALIIISMVTGLVVASELLAHGYHWWGVGVAVTLLSTAGLIWYLHHKATHLSD